MVKFTGEDWACDCPDFEFRRQRCKYILAVCMVVTQRETRTETIALDGTKTVTTTKEKRLTYKQNWPAYNAAQTQEKETFLRLLADLCGGVQEPERTFGRPRLPLREMLFCAAFKVYSTMSGRRFASDLRDAQAKG